MRAMLIAVGNASRGDEGVAHRVLDLLGSVPQVVTHDVVQLTPELAIEIEPAATVIFLDVDTRPGEPRLEKLEPDEAGRSPAGHRLSPEELVLLARRRYGFRGVAWLCRVPGEDFSAGERLSPLAERNARRAAEMLRSLPWLAPAYV